MLWVLSRFTRRQERCICIVSGESVNCRKLRRILCCTSEALAVSMDNYLHSHTAHVPRFCIVALWLAPQVRQHQLERLELDARILVVKQLKELRLVGALHGTRGFPSKRHLPPAAWRAFALSSFVSK